MIVCFYGHKGGAGRSAAVANVAPLLSAAGYRVLIVDLDLEAPGIHRFFGIPDDECEGGLIDLVHEFAERLKAEGDVALPEFPDRHLMEPRFVATKTPDGVVEAADVRDLILGPRVIGAARLETGVRILPAGRFDAQYAERVASFDWSARWADLEWQSFFGWLKAELESRCEVVFLDARAGVTDLAAVGLFGLADRVVMLTPPTGQALDGSISTARALAAAGRGPSRHGTLLVPSRVNKDADREHLGYWVRSAQTAVQAPDLLPVWTETHNRNDPESAAQEMLVNYQLPEIAVHAVGEPLVALRMLERGIAQDDLQDRYAFLAGTIQRWVLDSRREAAHLEGLLEARDVMRRIEEARGERRLEELPALYGRLADVTLEGDASAETARAAAEYARQGSAAAALLGDEMTELRLRIIEGKCLFAAGDPAASETLLAGVVRRIERRPELIALAIEGWAHRGRALAALERDEEALLSLRTAWEAADNIGTPDVLLWRVQPRRWASRVHAGSMLSDAWELAQGGPREIVIPVGTDLALQLGGTEGATVARACAALALEEPHDPVLRGSSHLAYLMCEDSTSIAEWKVVINTLLEGKATQELLAIAYRARARQHRNPKLRDPNLTWALQRLLEMPFAPSSALASLTHECCALFANDPSRSETLVTALDNLRERVEVGHSWREETQIAIIASHLEFVRAAPDRNVATRLASVLAASLRARPWVASRGGWRQSLVGVAALGPAIATRDVGPRPERVSQVREVLAAMAMHPTGSGLLYLIKYVMLENKDRESLLLRALELPDACDAFKAAVERMRPRKAAT